jgi:serine/threonine protein kinase
MPTIPEPKHRYTFGSGARPLEGYTIKRAIGRGGFGEVYYATSDAGKEVALKLILRNLEVERRGVQQCMNLKSPNLITIYDLRTNPDGDTFVIMEYVAGPSLANVLAQNPTGLPLHEVRHWLQGLIEGVAYLHDHGIVHRDLKPGNLFMEEGIVKIGDYGLSKAITGSQQPGHSDSVGTCHYMAPEISTGKYTKAIDIYAMGIILYEMITGRVPFDGESVGEVLMKHLTSRPDLSPLPEPYRSIVARALAKDPNHRPKTVYDLSPVEAASRLADVQFVGDERDGAAVPPNPGPRNEEVLKIEDDSIFYIGPNTWPTRQPTQPPTWRDRLIGRRAAPNRTERPPGQPIAQRRPAPPSPPARPAAVVPVRQATPTRREPTPPPPPPPLPSGRVRVAELASSMLLATPLSALAAGTAWLVGAVAEPSVAPEQIAALFGLVLLAVWGVLGLNKAWESRNVDTRARRLAGFGIGAGVGSALVGLAQWAHLDLGPLGDLAQPRPDLVRYIGPIANSGLPGYLEMAAYFGLAFGLIGWWKLTGRDRKSRFRVWPVLTSGLVAFVLSALCPEPLPAVWGPPVVIASAVITQLVSPWNRQAAAYALWARKAKPAPVVKTA